MAGEWAQVDGISKGLFLGIRFSGRKKIPGMDRDHYSREISAWTFEVSRTNNK